MDRDLESAAWKGEPTGSSPGPAPLWVWLFVLALGAIAIYSGYSALTTHQLYQEAETARVALARDKDRLEANASDLKQQLDQANKRNDATESALKQSRADTAAASAQIGDLQGQVVKLQGQVNDLQAKTGTLESAVTTAEANSKGATTAKETLQSEVDSLKGELAVTQKKLDEALADLARARPQPAPPAP